MNKKRTDYMVLVNGENRLPEGYENTMELVSVENAAGWQYLVERKTYEAFLRLREDLLKNDGLQAELISSYRSVDAQEKIFQERLAAFGEEYARKYVAIPGHSEHHTGLAIDVSFLVDGKISYDTKSLLSMDPLFQTAHKKLSQYGFILRYPQTKESVTKIGYEPWHFRYIDSPKIAGEIAAEGICFEEYHSKEK